jgi:hypothetical protein
MEFVILSLEDRFEDKWKDVHSYRRMYSRIKGRMHEWTVERQTERRSHRFNNTHSAMSQQQPQLQQIRRSKFLVTLSEVKTYIAILSN